MCYLFSIVYHPLLTHTLKVPMRRENRCHAAFSVLEYGAYTAAKLNVAHSQDDLCTRNPFMHHNIGTRQWTPDLATNTITFFVGISLFFLPRVKVHSRGHHNRRFRQKVSPSPRVPLLVNTSPIFAFLGVPSSCSPTDFLYTYHYRKMSNARPKDQRNHHI